MVALSLVAATAQVGRADEKKTTKVVDAAYLSLDATNTASDLEVGVAFDTGTAWVPRVYVRSPFSDKDEQLVRLESSTRTAKVGLAVDYELDLATESSGRASYLGASLAAEYGVDEYEYYPAGDKDAKQDDLESSFTVKMDAKYAVLQTNGRTWVPQLAVAYDRTYESADKIGVVQPSMDGGPDTVEDLVIEPPAAKPKLGYRVGAVALLTKPGLGLFYVGERTGEGGRFTPGGGDWHHRGELWLYLFPANPANTRVGVGAFVERTDKTTPGVLLQVKFNTSTIEY